ncbi:MAG: hypothetical protein PVG39_01380 [Desulfobacteraceae bacterium]|jgi:hypothetical protein
MSDALIDQLSDREYCYSELRNVRSVFSTKPYTEDQFDGIQKTLGLMYLYCPEDLQDLVLSHMQEAETRFLYCGLRR